MCEKIHASRQKSMSPRFRDYEISVCLMSVGFARQPCVTREVASDFELCVIDLRKKKPCALADLCDVQRCEVRRSKVTGLKTPNIGLNIFIVRLT